MRQIFNQNKGFTIVELMVALTVLSTILLLSTVVMINIGTLYNKGINAAKLQNMNRTVSSEISTALQFSGQAVSACTIESNTYCATGHLAPDGPNRADVYSICINRIRYSFIMNRESGGDPYATPAIPDTPHVLWRDEMNSNSSCNPLDIRDDPVVADAHTAEGNGNPSQGYEMVSDKIRLTKFKIKETTPLSRLYNVDTWLAYGDTDLLNGPDSQGVATCNSNAGQQYCGTSSLSTTVIRRIE